MSPETAFDLIREHLADELQLDPGAITLETDIRKDLDADSLDLYGLVQELEDTHGVVMTDAEAAAIVTVADVVEMVVAKLQLPEGSR